MVTVAPVREDQQHKVVGTRPIRPDGLERVTGLAQYGADVQVPHALVGKVLRSPHAHASIRGVDISKALALPGVKAVVTAADLPSPETGILSTGESAVAFGDLSRNVLAREKALYQGHPIAAVAATSAKVAEQALGLIEVDYELLPPVLDVRQAMAPDAPLLHPDQKPRERGVKHDEPSNIAAINRYAIGDVAAGFAQAEVTVEREYTTKMVHQGYIEPHASTALWTADDQITIWTTTQGHFSIREQTANVLHVPVSKIKVIATEIGGGFGGKIPVYLEPIAAVLSRQAGAPVKMAMTREEVFQASGPTSGSWMKVKVGATRDGRIVAGEATLAFEAGAFKGSSVVSAAIDMFAPYAIENESVAAFDVVVNKPKTSAYRAPGAPIGAFAMESALDELAIQLGLDPLELRLQNSAVQGTRLPSGVAIAHPIGHVECLEAARDSDHWRSPLPISAGAKKRARGIASGFWPNAPLKTSVTVSVLPDGTVSLVEGNPDIGGTRASLSMQLAESLGIPYESVKATVADTDSIGYNDVTGGSRTTYAGGFAVHEAALDVQHQLIERAALIWSVDAGDVRYENGVIIGPGDGQLMTFKEIAGQLNKTGAPVVGRATVSPKTTGFAYGTHIADVEVDTETGKVDVLRYTIVQDAGKAIHPSYVEGQMQGGVAQGVGWALNEEYYYDDQGHLMNGSFLDYRMPTTLDLPMIDCIIVEVPHPPHPYGVRGVGEVPIVPPLATVGNAVSRALDHRFTALPISPRQIVETLYG